MTRHLAALLVAIGLAWGCGPTTSPPAAPPEVPAPEVDAAAAEAYDGELVFDHVRLTTSSGGTPWAEYTYRVPSSPDQPFERRVVVMTDVAGQEVVRVYVSK